MRGLFARTKILCTIGPATDTKERIRDLLDAGLDGFRLNFSHGSHNYFSGILNYISEVCTALDTPAALLQDLSGPKIRIGALSSDTILLEQGKTINITTDNIPGTAERITINYKNLINEAVVGDRLLVDDGKIKLHIVKKHPDFLIAEIVQGGLLRPRKGVNLPGMKLSMPALTEKDYFDLEFGLNYPFSFIAMSFVRRGDDIRQLKSWLKDQDCIRPVIAKIEKPEAVENFEEILSVSDGIMVARGDLGVEIAPQEVPVIQKHLIKRCNQAGKLVITATQMLESMVNNSLPTRAEASDVANAVIDGTDAVMLSAETSVGAYPVEAVKIMNEIIERTESAADLQKEIIHDTPLLQSDNLFDAAGKAVTIMAEQLRVKAIVVFTQYGRKARVISKFRPDIKIIAFSKNNETVSMLSLYYGVASFYFEAPADEDNAIINARRFLSDRQILQRGDLVIFTSGSPSGESGRRNWMRIETI